MPPRDSRTASDVEAAKKRARRRVKVKKVPKAAPRVRDNPAEYQDIQVPATHRNFVTHQVENPVGLGPVAKALGKATAGLALKSSEGVPLTVGPRAPRGPKLTPQQEQDAKLGLETFVGPNLTNLLTGQGHVNPYWAVGEAALLPFGISPLKSPTAATALLRGARGVKEGVAARDLGVAAEEATRPILRVPPRVRSLGDSAVPVAAARSRTGRVIERGIDKARPVLSRLPIMKTPEQVWARDAERQITFQAKAEALPGVIADRKIKSLNRAQKYALYAMGTETSPEQWVRFYTKQLETATDPLERSAIKVHIANFHKATRYVVEDGDSVALTGESRKKMQNAYDALQGSSEMRDQILARGGYLDPETIINRRSMPGRIARGAQYTPEEIHANNVVKASPSRQQLRDSMRVSGVDDQAAEAQLNILDHQNRAYHQQETKALQGQEKKLQREIDALHEKEAEGEQINEQQLRAYEEELAVVQANLRHGVPYDALYRKLGHVAAEHPPELEAWYQAIGQGDLHYRESTFDPLVQELSKSLKAQEPKRGPVQDNFTHFTEQYGKTRGAYIADLPHEDRIREGYGRDIAPRGAAARPVDYENTAAEMILQATGADTHFTHSLDTLMSVRQWIEGKGINPDELGAALRSGDIAARETRFSTGDRAFASKLATKLASQIGRKKGLDPAGLQAGIERVLATAREGAPYKEWYEKSGKRILDAAGGNKVEGERIAQLVALYSAATEVGDNMGRALRAFKQWKAGEKISVRKDLDGKALDILEGKPWSGRKTNTFYRNMLEEIDPEKYKALVKELGVGADDVTVDRWVYATFGLPPSSGQYYSVLQDVYRAVQKRLKWEKPKQVQAASWVIEKRDGLMRRFPKLTQDEAMQRAMLDYSSAMDEPVYTTRFPVEARPGSSDVIPEYASWSPDVQKAFLEAKIPALNRFFEESGLPFTVRGDVGAGFWMGENGLEVNPAIAIDVHSGHVHSVAAAQEMSKAGESFSLPQEEISMWNSVAAAMAHALHQAAASWFRPLRAANRSQETLVHVALGRGATEAEMTQLADKLGNDAWFSHADDGVYIARADWSELGMPEWRQLVVSTTDALGDGERTWYGHVSGYLEGDDLERSLSNGRGPSELSQAADRLRQASDQVDNAFRADPEGAAAAARQGEVGGLHGSGLGGGSPERLGDTGNQGLLLDESRGANDASVGDRQRAIPRSDQQNLLAIEPGVRQQLQATGGGFLHGVQTPPGHPVSQLLTGSAEKSAVTVSENTLIPTEIWTHELGHFWQQHFPGVEKKLKRYLGDSHENWVEAWMEYVLDLYPQRRLPRTIRSEFDKLSAAILKEAEQTGASFVRQGMPRPVAELFDTTLWYKALKGGRVRGAEDFTGGIYTAVERGFPVSLRHPLASARHRLQALGGLFQGKTGVKRGFVDPSVKKHFTGRSVETGWIKIPSLGKASYNALLKAIRMDNVRAARVELLKASTEVPHAADDIAIFVNPAQRAPEQLKRFWETVQEMGEGMKVNELSLKEVNDLDNQLLDQIHLSAFPDQVDGTPVKRLAVEILEGLREPIDGVRWVSSNAFHESELFSAPTAFYARQNNWGKLEALGVGIDTVNDLMKLSVLPLNPAYAPMNLLGNLAMNLMQQGPFALINLPRAALLSRELDSGVSTAVDYYMGRGVMHLTETDRIAKHLSGSISHLMGAIVDMIPRRAAFLHEAYAMGYRSGDDIRALLSHPGLRNDLHEVVQRANDAIVDYERLSPFERKYLQRILFIYPWIKGASRYTFRFPAEHPLQALGFAYLYERQQQAANEQLGARPWYAEFDIPIGEVQRFGQEYPMVINPKQLLPFTTPYDVGTWLAGWFTGSDQTQSPVEALQPFWPALITSMTGYDSFAQREVPRGPATFFHQAMNFPLLSAVQNVGKTDAQLEESASNRLYPRNHQDELLKAALGSLAPTPYNAEKGQFYAEGNKGQTPEEKARAKQKQIAGLYDPSLQPKVDMALQTKVEFEHEKDALRKQYKTSNLSDEQVTEALLNVALRHTDGIDRAYVMGNLNATNAGKIRGALEKELGWNIIDAATAVANAKAKDAEAKAEGTVAHAG